MIGQGVAQGDVAPVNYPLLTSHNEVFESIAAITGLGATLNGGVAATVIPGREAIPAVQSQCDARERRDRQRPSASRIICPP